MNMEFEIDIIIRYYYFYNLLKCNVFVFTVLWSISLPDYSDVFKTVYYC